MTSETPRWLTTQQAADLLGVRLETIYAYVSRGVLQRHKEGRGSVFARAEVERLAERNKKGGRAGALEVVIDTELTLLDPDGGLWYRGYDALELATTKRFEQVADLLWGLPGPRTWQAPAAQLDVARRAQAALPDPVRPIDRMRVVVAALAACSDRDDRRPEAVTNAARETIAAIVDALPELSPSTGETIAHRLWARLSSRSPGRGEIKTLNAALVLMADHELAASTLAARIAASVWANPYLVLLTGLAAAGGVLHAASSRAVEPMLRADDPVTLFSVRLKQGEAVPGFGHRVYLDRDPRADVLLELLRKAGRKRSIDDVVEAVLEVVERYGGPAPNVDFALAALTVKAGLAPGSGEVIFLLARAAGVIAHALEEYPHRLRFRPRALYVGPSPGPSSPLRP